MDRYKLSFTLKSLLSIFLIFLCGNAYAGGMGLIFSGGFSSSISAPAAPTNIYATPKTTLQITMTWTKSSGATNYDIKYGTSTGSYTTTISNVGDVATYDVPSLSENSTYYLVVVAKNSGGSSPNSSEVISMPKAFDYVVSGGTITNPGSGVQYRAQVTAETYSANMIRTQAVTKAAHTITTKFKVTASSFPSNSSLLILSCATSKPTSRGEAFTPNQGTQPVFRRNGASGSFTAYIGYVYAEGAMKYWNGSEWVTGEPAPAFAISLNTEYKLILETTTTQWRYTLKTADDITTIYQTAWTNWSVIYNVPTSLYLFSDLYASVTATDTTDITLYKEE